LRKFDQLGREDVYEYPVEVLREAAAALVRKDGCR